VTEIIRETAACESRIEGRTENEEQRHEQPGSDRPRATDLNGYLPTHNQRYSLPLTGNLAFDLVNNRTKRIFGDRTGIAAARNEAPYLLQRYRRDTGELMADLSVPVRVRGKHWGCVRIGYRQVEKP
jgi:hypothetical protein